MIRSYLLFSKLFAHGDIIWRALPIRSMSLPTAKTSCTFRRLRCYPDDKPNGLNTSLSSTSSFISDPADSVPNPTLLLDDGTSTPKRGRTASPESTHRTYVQSLPPNSSTPPFARHTYNSLFFKPARSWTSKDSMPTSSLLFHPTRPLRPTSRTHQIPDGLPTRTASYA